MGKHHPVGSDRGFGAGYASLSKRFTRGCLGTILSTYAKIDRTITLEPRLCERKDDRPHP